MSKSLFDPPISQVKSSFLNKIIKKCLVWEFVFKKLLFENVKKI
jgi:hypothetical protein